MRSKSIKIGNVITPNNVFFAPMAGFSDFAMRSICLGYGAGLAFGEMVSCKGLIYKNENTADLLYTTEDEKIKCAQIFGNDPFVMRKAIELPEMEKFDIIDINFGCPMPKIYNNGEGSALLKDPLAAERIVRECKKSGKPITCKMRIGIDDEHIAGTDFAKALEQGGADMITVHGRTKKAVYAGEVNFDVIADIKKSVSVPVIANGGIFTKEDADDMILKTGADGVMIARGALENPFIFAEITGRPFVYDKKSLIKRHIALLLSHYDERFVAVSFRKQLSLYIKGIRGGAEFRRNICELKDANALINAVDELFSHAED